MALHNSLNAAPVGPSIVLWNSSTKGRHQCCANTELGKKLTRHLSHMIFVLGPRRSDGGGPETSGNEESGLIVRPSHVQTIR
jgi:hypothetical protein